MGSQVSVVFMKKAVAAAQASECFFAIFAYKALCPKIWMG